MCKARVVQVSSQRIIQNSDFYQNTITDFAYFCIGQCLIFKDMDSDLLQSHFILTY